jgi:Holliday junction resolvasome RuvABC endonuclease subunit
MTKPNPQRLLVVAIAPSTTGFGFAVLEGKDVLVDWGRKEAIGDKNAGSLSHVEAVIAHYQPEAIALEDTSAKGSRRAPRIRKLTQSISALAASRHIKVALFSRKQINHIFFPEGKGTKHGTAEIVARRFPDELGLLLPPKRRPWKKEDPRMGIFNAVALALVFRKKEK